MTVSVNFSSPAPPRSSLSGFLLSAFGATPALTDTSPLAPTMWRVGVGLSSSLDRALLLSPRVTVVVSDLWGYPMNNGFVQPWANLSAWQEVVRDVARQVAATGQAQRVFFELWNEPDLAQTWSASTSGSGSGSECAAADGCWRWWWQTLRCCT